MSASDQLTAWIDMLRTRLVQGDLHGLAPFDVGEGTGHLPGAQTVRNMLADLADLNTRMAVPLPPIGVAARNRRLLNQFQQLRDMLGAHPTPNEVDTH